MLEINISGKKYFDKIILQNINITIEKNGIYGVIGKNSHGKTTFFKCILGLTNYEGNCSINNNRVLLQNTGWVPTEPPIYEELTAKEFCNFYTHLLDLKKTSNKPLFEVSENQLIKEFSTGMKKKVYLNAVFQKEYTLYILDEPFNGLDLESNFVLMNYLRQLSKTSIILISSHILEILYKDCDKIFLVKDMRIETFERNKFEKIEETLLSSQT